MVTFLLTGTAAFIYLRYISKIYESVQERMEVTKTQKALLASGRKYFLEKGFKSAPLRKIVADAGFTLGAFYGYYKTKEELFYALTDEVADGFNAILASIAQEMDRLPDDRKLNHMIDCYLDKLPELVDYICEHRDEMTLLIKCSDGTKYENFLDGFIGKSQSKIESAADLARSKGRELSRIDQPTFDLLMSGYFSMLGNIILSGRAPERIREMMSDVAIVYKEGMIRLLEIRATQ